MLSRNEVLCTINDLYDTLGDGPEDYITAKFIEVGRERVYEDSTRKYGCAVKWVDEDGANHVTSFADYRRNKVDKLPDWMSFDDFCCEYHKELAHDYSMDVKEAERAYDETHGADGK